MKEWIKTKHEIFCMGYLYPLQDKIWNIRFRYFNWTIKKPF